MSAIDHIREAGGLSGVLAKSRAKDEEFGRQVKAGLRWLFTGTIRPAIVLGGGAFYIVLAILSPSKPTQQAAAAPLQVDATDEQGRTCNKIFNSSYKCSCQWGGPSGDEGVRLKWLAEHCKKEWIR